MVALLQDFLRVEIVGFSCFSCLSASDCSSSRFGVCAGCNVESIWGDFCGGVELGLSEERFFDI